MSRANEKVGRNDPCPCGSGRKYKQCCAAKQAQRAKLRDSVGRGFLLLLGPIGVALLIAVSVSALRGPGESEEVRRIWSAEHNHWHLLGPDGTEVEARPGLVWSDEQKRFVDAQPITEAARKHVTAEIDHQLDALTDEIEDEAPPAADPEL